MWFLKSAVKEFWNKGLKEDTGERIDMDLEELKWFISILNR